MKHWRCLARLYTINFFSLAMILATSNMAFSQSAAASGSGTHKWAVVVHGGAGVIERSSMTAEAEAGYRAGITEALNAAAAVLDKGGSSVDAVEAAIKLLEDNPIFNAGRGAVFAADGTNQLDAAIMDGKTMQAGAVADVQHTRHPISLARAVMEQSPHVMLVGRSGRVCRACPLGAGAAELLLHRTPLAAACRRAEEAGLADPAAPGASAIGASQTRRIA
jgi:hypothetical protein